MRGGTELWDELAARYRIVTEGPWRRNARIWPGKRLESQIFSSSSLENVHDMGAFSIIRAGASIGGLRLGRFSAIGAGFVCAPPEHPTDSIGSSSVFLKPYPWTEGGAGDAGFYAVPPSGRRLETAVVEVGSDVWIGRDVYVRGGVRIGDGAIVAARSVVVRDVPPYAVMAGVPARQVRDRFAEGVVADLLALRWWDLDPAWMAAVDQTRVEACVAHLKAERDRLAPLRPWEVVFDAEGYRAGRMG